MSDTGALLATFIVDKTDYTGKGWVYPGCVGYTPSAMVELARTYGLKLGVLDWVHPRQTWGIFTKVSFDSSLITGGPITWNRFATHAIRSQQ